MATDLSGISSTALLAKQPDGLAPPASTNTPASARTDGAVPATRAPYSRAIELACGGGAPQPHIEFTQTTNPATIASDLAAAAKSQGGPAREFTVYAFPDYPEGQPVDGAFVSGAPVTGQGMKGGVSWPLDKLVATVMASGALQRGGTLALGNMGQDKLTPGLLSGLAQKHGITIAIDSRGSGIDLFQPNGTVQSDESRAIGGLRLRGGCGPGLQKNDG